MTEDEFKRLLIKYCNLNQIPRGSAKQIAQSANRMNAAIKTVFAERDKLRKQVELAVSNGIDGYNYEELTAAKALLATLTIKATTMIDFRGGQNK